MYTAPHPEHPLQLSQRLMQIVDEPGPEKLTFTQLSAKLHARAWGGLLLIFGAINVIPLPPATSWFFAIPLMIVSSQMVWGRTNPWFPARIDRRGVTKQLLRRLIDKMQWVETRVEKLFKPRMPALTGPAATRIIGAICFILAIIAAIPIPLFHMAPAAAIALFGLALIYRDGVVVIAAGVASILAIIVDALVVGSGAVALAYFASRLGL